MNKLQGLSINLDLDATRVDEGMKGLKRTLGSVNSEMKANLSAFGKGEKPYLDMKQNWMDLIKSYLFKAKWFLKLKTILKI